MRQRQHGQKWTESIAVPDDTLEIDEAWSFVRKRVNQRWLWTVMLRRTRHIIAFVFGDRSERACQRLWRRIPPDFRQGARSSDFWKASAVVVPKITHDVHVGGTMRS